MTDPLQSDGAALSFEEVTSSWMQEIAPFGIFTTDPDLRIRSWNHWLVHESGLSAESVVGRKLIDVFPDLVARRLHERFALALKGEISVLSTALHKYLLPMGHGPEGSESPRMLQTARIAPLPRNGEVVGTITIIEDVTQREVQAGILHRQSELDRILSSALAAFLQSMDPPRDVAGILPSILPPLGLDAYAFYLLDAGGSSLGLVSASGISPRNRELIASLAVNEDERGPSGASKRIAGTVNTHERILETLGMQCYCSFPLEAGERLIGLISFGSYKESKIPVADLNVLTRIARYLSLALDRVWREREMAAASRAKDDFLAALSHELRTPLNPVLLVASDAAANPEFPAEAREAFSIIQKNALLEARLIDDLLDLTRIEHGKLTLEMRPLDLHSTIRDALSTVAGEIGARDLAVSVFLDAKEFTILGDSARLQQAFWNIINNAIKFTPRAGNIRITSECDPSSRHITIRVTDSGIGIEEHEATRIFAAFSQGDHAEKGRAHRFGGLGLGLAITRKLVEIHGGVIEATSKGKNLGSTFSVKLPLAPQGQASSSPFGTEHGRRGVADGVAGNPSTPSKRILVVEDHESTRLTLAQLLRRRHYEVIAVATSAEALNEASKVKFDLVLSDIGLADSDGFSLMKELRRAYGLKGIALTGYGMEGDVARGKEAGFIAHLTKPISVEALNRALALGGVSSPK